jgi:redox-sensitive bicupin YhaK (pirin superfamily)
MDVTVAPESTYLHPVREDHTVLAYVIEGSGYFDQERDSYAYEVEGANYFDIKRNCLVNRESLVIFESGDAVSVSTENEGVRFLLISGRRINEPVAWFGPIVMNTQDELRQAFDEYENGTFIKESGA